MQREQLAHGGGGSSRDGDEGVVVMLRRSSAAARVTCGLCRGLVRDATTVTECLHSFCRSCIYEKFADEEDSCCPTCNIDLGCSPLDKIRADHNLQSVRENLFPSKRQKNEGVPSLYPASVFVLPLRQKVGIEDRREQTSTPIVLATEESSAEEILQIEIPPRTTKEVVQKVLTMTTGTSKGMPQDMDVQIERISQEDKTEEVAHETIETQDEDDHILESQDIGSDPTRGVFRLVQLDQSENEVLESSPSRIEKKDVQDLMTSVKRCWKVNVDMIGEIKAFAEEKKKECLLAKVEQENAESALYALRLKLSEAEKRSERSAVAIAEKIEEIRLLTQKNEKLQEILDRQSEEGHNLFEQNKVLIKEKKEVEKAKEDLQKTSYNKDLQIQDLKEMETWSRTVVQELEKKVDTLMKVDKEINTVTGNSFSQISASLREIAKHLKAPVTPLATKMTLDDFRNDIYTYIIYIQKHIKTTICQSLTRVISQALNRVLLKIDLLYGDSVDLQKLVHAPKFKTKEAGMAAQAKITPVVAEIIKNIEDSAPAIPSSAPGSSVQ